jgi:acetyltransferase-like isoleucine patch superfamily enzyme
MFDRSPLGLNHWLGLRFRCMVGRHIFKSVGKGVKIFPNVQFSRGYTVAIEDNCTLESGAVLDDRADLVLRAGTTVSAP